ncbi:MAG: methyltransferase type 12 [Verrucomicrobiales bacterium]|nr:methyltransferase type 12 [Verrucomicrobiales bacterium]
MKAELSDVDRGAAAYTRRSLAFYNWWVLKVSNNLAWNCPTEKILELYREHITENHLEVGAGTGFFLQETLPQGMPRVALLDINRDCLDYASKKIADYNPEVFQENILEPLDLPGARFDSMAINYLLHCLPGNLEMKAETVFDNLIPFLKENGTVFGSTILGADVRRSLPAILLMKLYNRKGIFSNKNDSLGAIMEILSSRFKTFNVEVHGCVVLFWAKGLRASCLEGRSEAVPTALGK